MESFGLCPSLLCIKRGTTSVQEAGSDEGTLTWGRWTNGNASLSTFGGSSPITLNANQGLHYLIGVPTSAMPTSGAASYNLIGATSATTANGVTAAGQFTGQVSVAFGPGLGTKIGVQGNVNMGSFGSWSFSTQGGTNNVSTSQLQMSSPNRFSGTAAVTTASGSNGAVCGVGSCTARINGGFFGSSARQLGMEYSIGSADSGSRISGVAAFKKP
jgi:hypothetical protein